VLAAAFADLEEQLELLMPDEDEIRRACDQIRDLAPHLSTRRVRGIARRLAEQISGADPTDAAPVLELLTELLARLSRPLSLLDPLLTSEDPDTLQRGVELALDLVEAGALDCDLKLLRLLAPPFLDEDNALDDEDLAPRLAGICNTAGEGVMLPRLLRRKRDPRLRRLAAHLLDLEGDLPSAEEAADLLGARAWEVLGPFLLYTRADFRDLVTLTDGGKVEPTLVSDIERAVARHGEDVVRRVVAELGWRKLNQGLLVEAFVQLDWPHAAPLFVHPEEVSLFATDPPPEARPPCYLVRARGGLPGRDRPASLAADPVDSFRRINIDHAELLSEMLETAPADRPKVERIIALMDKVVAAFHGLFAERAEQYAILPDVWARLRDEATAKLNAQHPDQPLSADLVRLVLAFEDPATLGEVRTIHGLKRLLHQQGLKLGFELVDTAQSPSHTVDLLLLPARGKPVAGPTIQYTELEGAPEIDPDPWLPHPVKLAVDGLAWQLLHGVRRFPGMQIFVFGNEVQYYVTFRNHPAFLRVDFSPPQRGGMLDLEYYGVSNYELDNHPNLKLDAICAFYRAMQLEVRTEGTRLFVRYDKERSHSLGDLLEKVGALLRFTPFMMDVDWTVGSLPLAAGLRRLVVDAWAERFARSAIFPVHGILTRDRRRILLDTLTGPAGTEEIPWSGQAPYRDCWSGLTPPDLWSQFSGEAERLGLPTPTAEARTLEGPLPLLAIHRHILDPVRRRLQSGQLRVVEGRLEPADSRLCVQEHETELFARLLAADDPASERVLLAAVEMAPMVADLEKFVPLHTTGFVGGLRIERGRVSLRGGELRLFAGRDQHGVVRAAVCTFADRLLRVRPSRRARWRSNAWTDGEALLALLRGANYSGDRPLGREPDPAGSVAELRALARRGVAAERGALITHAGILTGVAAAPGRATGRAVFGTDGRRAEDLAGCLLVAREIRPTDSGFLMQSGGVISTGGAVLSHAALLAIQFGKPALVVEAHWDESGALPALTFKVTLYRAVESIVDGLEVCRRSVSAHTSGRLEEGDLCLLDSASQQVRVLGQDADTLVLWQGFQLLARGQAARRLADTPRQILEIRAQLLRARHQVGKALGRLTSPEVADFAVEEIVLGEAATGLPVNERAEFVHALLDNPAVSERVQPRLQELTRHLAERCRQAAELYLTRAPDAPGPYEPLCRRLQVLRLRQSLEMVLELLETCGVTIDPKAVAVDFPGDGPARERLRHLESKLLAGLGQEGPLLRHRLRRLRKLHEVLPGPPEPRAEVAEAQALLEQADAGALARRRKEMILQPEDCGLETYPLIGWKGANLAEMDRLAGPSAVPPWFAVTDAAFGAVLNRPLDQSPTRQRHLPDGPVPLGEAIGAILASDSLEIGEKARVIERFWDEVDLPAELVNRIDAAYTELLPPDATHRHVALRSSSTDEDTETSMQAGVYDSFLFVRGLDEILAHLRRTWAGMWSARALYGRHKGRDLARRPSCGVIVQRMIRARVSGVLQTVNVAGDDLREMVISVGLGLGEGIVSGLVAADLVTVVKDQGPDSDPVHFNYLTNDKPRQMVFDTRQGRGTCLEDTLYHQRLRPAIEYTELCEIARQAMVLERAYGYPLDMEFALEDDRLWLLQARPITAILAEHRATVTDHPLQTGD
jgi:phosphohistidine swiveling domain-containing protein